MFEFLSQKFGGVLGWLKDRGRLTEDNISQATEQIKEALLEADVPLAIVEDFLQNVQQEIIGKKIIKSLNPGEQMIKIVHDKVLDFLGGKNANEKPSFAIPSVIMVMGLQGSGKTTTIGKIVHWTKQQAEQRGKKRRILVASIDFYRPAAVDQLEIVTQRAGVDFYRASNTNPIKAAQEIGDYFKKQGYEFLFLDTAGRLHLDEQMMDELKQVKNLLQPKYRFLVLDAMTGQESLNVAQTFDRAIGFDSVVLTKMDSDTRGGAAFAFRYQLKKPISFVGSGEKIDDLESFIPERITNRMLGMGDLMTLLEKASEKLDLIDEKKDQDANKRFMQGNFTLQDFADQLGMMDKLGSVKKIASYLPGMGQVSSEQMEKGQQEMKRSRAIISSMTPKERLFPQLLDASRKKRIAGGAGVEVREINELLQKFEQTQQFAKMFMKGGMFKKMFK